MSETIGLSGLFRCRGLRRLFRCQGKIGVIKFIPVIHIPTWLIIWIIVIALIKVINMITGYVMRRELVVLHTAVNKVTGVLLFILPLTLTLIDLKYSGAFVSAVAMFAAIQEGHLIRTRKTDIKIDE